MTAQLELKLTPLPDTPAPKRSVEQAWLDWAATEWHSFHGRQMTVRWARDLALIRPLLRQHGENELSCRWRAFVRTIDEYFARRGWSVPCFSAAIDRYHGDRDRVPLVRRRHLLEAEENDRDPLSGTNLALRRRLPP